MATTIRLTRMGRKKRPFYRLVVLDSRKRRDGAYLANLGYYNPFCEPHEVELHAPEIIDWMSKGATLSETARSLLKGEGVLYQFSLVQAGLGEDEIAAKMTEWRDGAEARKQTRIDAAAAKAEAARKELAEKEKAEAEAKAAAEAAQKEAAAKEAAEKAAAEKAAAEEAAAEAAPEEAGEAEAPAEETVGEEKKDAGEDGEA